MEGRVLKLLSGSGCESFMPQCVICLFVDRFKLWKLLFVVVRVLTVIIAVLTLW